MKKIFYILVLMLFISTSSFSQSYERAVGIRIGSSIGGSYRQFLSQNKAFEAILDLDIIGRDYMKVKGSGYYLFHFNLNVDGLALFAGPGASAGVFVSGDYRDKLILSVDGMGGIEYKFNNAPIVLAFDWNPKVQIVTDAGFKPANFALTVRYTF
jgi:hypothetical protein